MPLPVAHSAAGLAVYLSVPYVKRNGLAWTKRCFLLFCLIFLANAPDLDFLPGMLIGQPNRFHHGASHSILSTLSISGGVWFICRKYFNELSGSYLFLIIFISAFSHIFLDFFSSDSGFPYGIPLFWPFSHEYFMSPFPLFRDVFREGGSNTLFFQTLLNENNLWEILLEVFFSVFLILVLYATKGTKKNLRWASAAVASLCFLGYYGLQIEPNWIQVNNYEWKNHDLQHDCSVVHISDLHLKNISYQENKLRKLLKETIHPDILMFTGDTLDPFGEDQKAELSEKTKKLASYIASLPGEKFLVWGEGVCNNRHLIGKYLDSNGVHVLEDESVHSRTMPEIVITGKLPELADFCLVDGWDGKALTASATELNSYLHLSGTESLRLYDYDLTGEVIFSTESGGFGITFYSHYDRHNDRFYRIRWSSTSPFPAVSPHCTGNIKGVQRSQVKLLHDTVYQFHIRCRSEKERTVIIARFWPQNESEPIGWQIDAWDDSALRLTNGTVGIWMNGRNKKKWIDNIRLVSLDDNTVLMEENFSDSDLFSAHWKTERKFTETISPDIEGKVNILLSHSPEIINNYKIKGFDLMLAGDTHGGQVCWPNGLPILMEKNLPPKWYSGLHDYHGMKVNISRGIGTSRLPVRLFCRPEISIFRFIGQRQPDEAVVQ